MTTMPLGDPPVIQLSAAGYTYAGPPPVRALKPADLVVLRGEHVAIMGPSGSGKSTLLNLLGLLDRPTEGTLRIDGDELGRASERDRAAVRASRIPKKAYFTAMRRSDWDGFRKVLEDLGVELPQAPEPDPEWMSRMDALEAQITTTVDISPFVALKRKALSSHASQIEESFFNKLPDEAFSKMFGRESFIRAFDVTGAPVPEDDLFAGLR